MTGGEVTGDQMTMIGDIEWRERVRVRGQVRSIRVRPWGDAPSMECRIVDGTGGVTVVFLGRRHVAGVELGSVLEVEGMVGSHQRRLAILNPEYELQPA